MGNRPSAILTFGVLLEGIDGLPWEDDGLDDWWPKECGFVPTKEVWDASGNKIPDTTLQDIDNYYAEYNAFNAAHPLPVELHYVDYWEADHYILAVPYLGTSADWDGAEIVDDFVHGNIKLAQEAVDALNTFCAKYLPATIVDEGDEEVTADWTPHWYLAAFYG